MKRTLFILSYSHLGGAETRAVDLAINLKNSITPIFLVYGRKNGDVQKKLQQKGIQVIQRKKFSWGHKSRTILSLMLIKETFFLLKTYFKVKPHSMMSFCADANLFLFCLNRLVNKKKTYWCQVDDFIQWRWKRLFLYAIRKSVNVIAVSDFIAEQIEIKTGRKKGNIITIPNRINPAGLIKNKTESSVIRVAVVGHINKTKNQGFVIQAVKQLIADSNTCNIELNLYGHITDHLYWDEIKTGEKWLHYRGYYDKNHIYNHTDIIVIASVSEASPLVFQEAIYFGIKVLCADIPLFKSLELPEIKRFSLENTENLVQELKKAVGDYTSKDIDLSLEYQEKHNEYIKTYKELLI